MAKRKKARTLGSSGRSHTLDYRTYAKTTGREVSSASREIASGRCVKAFDHLRRARESFGAAKTNEYQASERGPGLAKLSSRLRAQEARFVGRCTR